MRNILKKAVAAVLTMAICLGFTGCYSENKTWAAKVGDDTLPIGAYIYYLSSAYSEAAGKVDSDTEVMKATIDGTGAEEWVRNRAKEYLGAYCYVEKKFSELGLTLTEAELADAENDTASFWPYYQTGMEKIGISQSSFHKAYTLYNVKFRKIMSAMYGAGGEKALSDDELKNYFIESYYDYEYFYAPLTKTDEDGNSVEITDEEKAELKAKMETYVDKINLGETTVSEAAGDYAYESKGNAAETTYTAPGAVLIENMNESMRDAVASAEEGKAALAEITTNFYVVSRRPIADAFEEAVADESQKLSILSYMKGDEFNDFILEQGKDLSGVELNQTAINSVKLSTVIGDSKKGTSTAPSDEEE